MLRRFRSTIMSTKTILPIATPAITSAAVLSSRMILTYSISNPDVLSIHEKMYDSNDLENLPIAEIVFLI